MVGWEPFLYDWGTTQPNNIVRALPTETVTIGEGIARQTAKIRTRNETPIVIGESVVRQNVKARIVPTQTVTIGESLARAHGRFKTLSETVTIGEAINTVRSKIRTLSQSVTISESVLRGRQKAKTLTESITISELIARLKGTSRALSESVSTQYLARGAFDIDAYAVDAYDVDLGELDRTKGVSRPLATQSVFVSESISRNKSGQTGSALGILESVVISDSVARGRVARTRALIDNATPPASYDSEAFESDAYDTVSHEISDSVVRVKNSHRTLTTQIVSVSDGIVSTSRTIARIIVQTVTIGETLLRQVARSRPLAGQSVTISDSISKTLGKARNITESIDISEVVNVLTKQNGQIFKTIIEPLVVISDSISRQLDKVRSMESDENVTISESVKAIKNYIEPIPVEPVPEQQRIPLKITKGKNIWRYAVSHNKGLSKVESVNDEQNQHKLVYYLKQKLGNNWLRRL